MHQINTVYISNLHNIKMNMLPFIPHCEHWLKTNTHSIIPHETSTLHEFIMLIWFSNLFLKLFFPFLFKRKSQNAWNFMSLIEERKCCYLFAYQIILNLTAKAYWKLVAPMTIIDCPWLFLIKSTLYLFV